MQRILDMTAAQTVVAVDTPTGFIARGGPGVATHERGSWRVVVDALAGRRPSRQRLDEIVRDAHVDAIASVMRHFDAGGLELFALVGSSVVIAGSTLRASDRVGVLVDLDEGVVAMTVDPIAPGPEWLSLPGGTAVRWGRSGPGAFLRYTDEPTERRIARTAMSASSSS